MRGRVGGWADEGRRSRSRGQDDNATLNLVFAQFVLALHVTEEDFVTLMQNTSAVLVMVFIDVDHERSEPTWVDGFTKRRWTLREHMLHTYVENGNGLWKGKLFSHGTGALFWRTHRVSAVAEIAPRLGRGDWAYVSYRCTLQGNDYNPECDLVIAGVFRTTDRCIPQWDHAFQEFVKNRLRSDDVRFLCGIFEVENAQLEDVCRSCGATGPLPFFQPWQLNTAGGQLSVTHPLYIIPFGRCTMQVDVKGPPAEMPDWLWGHTSEFNVDFLPQLLVGEPHPLHLRDLGKVKQKAVDLQRWVPWIHQLLLWVGSSRNGRPMLVRNQRKQQYKRGGHDSGSGWNYDRSRGRSVDSSGGAASSGLDRDERRQYWSGVVQPSDW